MAQGKIIIALNSAWNLYNFRAGLIKALASDGYEVVAMAPRDDYAALLPSLGCRFVPVAMDTTGTSPTQDLRVFIDYLRLLRVERPDAYLGFTIKPNVYGSMAAALLGIPAINNVAGLGFAFHRDNWLTRLVTQLYKVALKPSAMVLFQNEEDRQVFLDQGIVAAQRSMRIPGSGVDIERFGACPPARQAQGQAFRFLLAARLLWEKGIAQYVAAARQLRASYPDVECCIAGFPIDDARKGVPLAQLQAWEAEGAIRYLGASDRIEDELASAHCVVLPSYYREGVPRILLEAAAARRPLITTDWIGCREVVDHGVNGLLCAPQDADALAQSMMSMLQLPEDRRVAMGEQGRDKVMRSFSEGAVIQIYRDLLKGLTGQRQPS